MAKNLLRAGHPVKVFDISPKAVQELVASGATAGESSKDVAAYANVIITMLPNSPEVKEVVLGENGVLEGVKPGTILVDMSSIAPLVSKELAVVLKEKDVVMLDAPVSGGEPKAIDGTLAIMVGGPVDAFEEVKDILGVMGASVTRVGSIGSGNTTKLANQIIVALNIAAMSEALYWRPKQAWIRKKSIRLFVEVWPEARSWIPKRPSLWKVISNQVSVSNSILKIY